MLIRIAVADWQLLHHMAPKLAGRFGSVTRYYY